MVVPQATAGINVRSTLPSSSATTLADEHNKTRGRTSLYNATRQPGDLWLSMILIPAFILGLLAGERGIGHTNMASWFNQALYSCHMTFLKDVV
jgi:hypothetical protein